MERLEKMQKEQIARQREMMKQQQKRRWLFVQSPNKVEGRKSVRGECRDKIYFGYAELKPDFMSEANKVKNQRLNA
jgi:hypothetical protein